MGSISQAQRVANPVKPHDGLALHKLCEVRFAPIALGGAKLLKGNCQLAAS
jgi:hypothetical protein